MNVRYMFPSEEAYFAELERLINNLSHKPEQFDPCSINPDKPHFVTEEMRLRANGLMAEFDAQSKLCGELRKASESLDRLADQARDLAHAKKHEASKILMGHILHSGY